MKKLTPEQKEKIKTGLELLCEETTSLDKFQKISALIKGFNPVIDKQLEATFKVIEKIQKVKAGDVISLSLEKIPEKTKKQKRYKKMLLLLLGNYRGLAGEVKRISGLQTALAGAEGVSEISKGEKVVRVGKIVATAKGPLGALTIAAAGIVAVAGLLNSKAVEITIKNVGCRPIEPLTEQVINIPGLRLPGSAIATGGQDVAKMPGLSFKLDATKGGEINLSALNLSRSYNLPGEMTDIIYDGQSLLGKTTEVKLGNAKTHEVIVKCGN
ncbi:MAG: hypothetical protein WC841_00020 [Candidatus Shapirobacteria bacterium]|jgi:hypothetical protein